MDFVPAARAALSQTRQGATRWLGQVLDEAEVVFRGAHRGLREANVTEDAFESWCRKVLQQCWKIHLYRCTFTVGPNQWKQDVFDMVMNDHIEVMDFNAGPVTGLNMSQLLGEALHIYRAYMEHGPVAPLLLR